MNQLSLELLKRQIKQLTGREVTVDRTKSGRYICKFIDFNMSPLALVGDSEEEAYKKLLQYLKQKHENPDPELPPAA